VDPGNMPQIHARLGSEEKEMIRIENSGHVITPDAEKEQVFQAADAFIQGVTGS
jgi:esterase/lipase